LATLGIYTAAVTAFGVLTGIANAFSNTLFSGYSALQGEDRRETLERGVFLGSRYLALVITPLAFGLLATSRIALAAFVGQPYVAGTLPLMILTAVYALTLVGTALAPLFLARGETFAYSGISIISVAVSFAVAFVLVPVSGMIGAALARGLAMVLSLAVTIWLLRRKVTFKLDLSAVVKSITASGVMAFIVALVQIPLTKAILLPAYALLGAVVYLMMLRLLRAVKVEDMELARSFFGGRLEFASKLLAAILLPKHSSVPGTGQLQD
jgi:O-antigen/teichoic acid export membrane protein